MGASVMRTEMKAISAGEAAGTESAQLSVVVPCYNEAESLAKLVGQLARLRRSLAGRYDVELVLVDDGSKDETWRLLNEHFSGEGAARLVRHETNRGIAAAIGT